jgi:6-pyruvoyltetrahydropterin/6-carboxytetrahydropterin synthase
VPPSQDRDLGRTRVVLVGVIYDAWMHLTVVRRYRFEAAHQLPWHPGKCRRLHGHSYVLEIRVSGGLDERGVVMDFAEVDAVVDKHVLEVLDHADLNEVLDNPTAELVASWIGERLDTVGLGWSSLRLWETQDGSVVLER